MADSINTKAKEYYDSDNSGGSLNSNLKDFLKSQGVSGTSLNTMWRNYAKDNGGESLNTRLGQLWGTSGSLISRWHKQLGLVWDDMKLFFDFRNIREQVSHPSAGSTSFDGDDYVDVGNVGNIKSLSFWVKADDITSHTDYAIDLNGTDYIKIVNGTVTLNGFAGGTNTIYVDSIVSSTLSNVNQWYYVSITSDTNRNASDFDIGRVESVGFFKGSLGNVSVDTGTLTQSQIQSIMYKSYADLTSSEKTNLVSWWGLDTDYTDSHGSNDGTNSGSTINSTVYGDNAPKKPRIADSAPDSVANYGTLYSGTALNFDHVTDTLAIGDIGNTQAIAFWMKTTDLDATDDIIYLNGSDYLSINSSGTIAVSGGSNVTTYVNNSTTANVVSGQWAFIVCTFDTINASNLNVASGSIISFLSKLMTWTTAPATAHIQDLYLNPELLPESPNGWWNLSEGTGTTAYDGSGNNNDGTITGATWDTANTDIPQTALIRSNVTAGVFYPEGLTSGQDIQGVALTNTDENVLTLNGAEYVEVSDSDSLSFGDGSTDSPFSVEAWIRMNDATGFAIMSKGVYNTNGEWWFGDQNGIDKLDIGLFDESGANTYLIARTQSTVTPYEGQWMHIVGTYDGTSNISGLQLYINGATVAMDTYTNGTYVAMENLSANIKIGEYNDTHYADGDIDEARIYSKALSADEVSKNYSAGLSKHS